MVKIQVKQKNRRWGKGSEIREAKKGELMERVIMMSQICQVDMDLGKATSI